MKTDAIKSMQQRIGVTPDGFWGPKSIAACQAHLRSLMPMPNPWPASDDTSMRKFYGREGEETNLVNLDVAFLSMKYEGKKIKTLRCHRKVSDSLLRVLKNISLGTVAWVLAEYGGCFNHRSMRGGSRPSKHSWGAAIDLAPGTNGNKQAWPVSSTMPLEVMEAFAREGWVSAGAFWGRDGMHFQATQ